MYFVIEQINGYTCVSNFSGDRDLLDYIDVSGKAFQFVDGDSNLEGFSLEKHDAIVIKGDVVVPHMRASLD